MKIIDKKKSTSTSGWKRWTTPIVSLDEIASVLKTNAHTTQMYSPTWTRAQEWHKCIDRDGVESTTKSPTSYIYKASSLSWAKFNKLTIFFKMPKKCVKIFF